jgi:hypothetical protein
MHFPKAPKPGTLADEALLRLMRGKHITHRDFDTETASYRLASSIHLLRKKGWQIESRPEVGITRTGRRCRYVRCAIPPRTLRRYYANPDAKRWLEVRT